jgi:spermidine/putrescine transport system ATP-binding protein
MRTILQRVVPTQHYKKIQGEALGMADRVAVINAGTLEQIGSPDDIINMPTTAFVARFVGHNNVLQGTVEQCDLAICRVSTPFGTFGAKQPVDAARRIKAGSKVAYVVSANCIREGSEGENSVRGPRLGVILRGLTTIAQIQLSHGSTFMYKPDDKGEMQLYSSEVTVSWSTDAAIVLPL